MSKATYFVISNNDGETYIAQMTEEALLRALQPNEFGDVEIVASDIAKSLPGSGTDYWRNKTLIIRGEIIVPKAKEVVTRFEL